MEMETDKREEEEHADQTNLVTHGSTLETEVDLSDRDETNDEHHDDDTVDYSDYTKQQLADLVKEISKDDNFKKVDHILREIKPLFDDIREKERAEALKKFISSDGAKQDFEFKAAELDMVFDANFKLIKDRKAQFFRQQEDNKNENYKRKLELLEKLRVLSDSEDTTDQFESFKQLQKEWKAIGTVPGSHAKTLWANYHALTDRFYDNQSIYFELKELDRRKNLEAKLELCVRAEGLVNVELLKDAIRELNELHHEFKHFGPVPKEDKEAVWQRFKSASDAVYAKRDAYMQNLRQELEVNMESKAVLSDEVQIFIDFQSDRIKEWNQKTKEILEVQKRWDLIGGLPRTKAKDVNKKFWTAFKTFFNNKNTFFKKLDGEREQNLQLKNDLVKKAIELKDSDDWEGTSNEFKSLQQKWKDIGPVPEKLREKIFKEFKDACDHFFEQRRTQHGKIDNEQNENLKKKEEICALLEGHAAAATGSKEILQDMQRKFGEIGFVPRKDINAIRSRYHQSVEKFISTIPGITDDDKGRISLETQLSDLRNDPMADRKIFQKEQVIRKKINNIENDIALWRNNLEFFGRSKNAEKFKDEFNEKINDASDHLKQLKEQLKLLMTV